MCTLYKNVEDYRSFQKTLIRIREVTHLSAMYEERIDFIPNLVVLAIFFLHQIVFSCYHVTRFLTAEANSLLRRVNTLYTARIRASVTTRWLDDNQNIEHA